MTKDCVNTIFPSFLIHFHTHNLCKIEEIVSFDSPYRQIRNYMNGRGTVGSRAGGNNRKRARSAQRRVGLQARPTAAAPAPGSPVRAYHSYPFFFSSSPGQEQVKVERLGRPLAFVFICALFVDL